IPPILVYWLAGYLIGIGDTSLSIGTIVAFTALQARLFFPLTGLLNVQVEVTSALALFDRIFEYLDMKQQITDAPDAVAIDPADAPGEVVFAHVSVRYRESQESATLDGTPLDAKPRSLVALVGPSGAGKPTLTYLIPRLHDLEPGRVLIDRHDARKVKLQSL